ncbi:MAG TPA: hypothetical protein PK370_02050 [Candidatus Woesebacteria bacterium]|nr:hypothetical protein [Candidatus Woesebacteria bacterium]HPJ16736.1 hypothetical protein [Candidatus Woesebacteria bacterium]
MPAKKEISLLPAEENANSFQSRFLRWLTSTGRFVIVFTELIVIMAFASRFVLDRKNSDLSEVLRQQKAIIESTADFEKEYQQLQQRLSFIKSFYANQPDYKSKITTLVSSTPPDIVFDSLKIETKDKDIVADLSVKAFDETGIINFITNLSTNPDIKQVTIKTIEKKSKDNNYTINIGIVYQNT